MKPEKQKIRKTVEPELDALILHAKNADVEWQRLFGLLKATPRDSKKIAEMSLELNFSISCIRSLLTRREEFAVSTTVKHYISIPSTLDGSNGHSIGLDIL